MKDSSPKASVVLTRCEDYGPEELTKAVQKQFGLLGGVEKFISRGDNVLLKPNFIAARPRNCATQTDPAVVLEVARLLKDYGGKPFVGDSPAWGNVFGCVKALELQEPLKKLGVPVKQLNRPKKCKLPMSNIEVGISAVALDADKIINLPKFKTHQQLVATFAIKNMFGCVSGKRKSLWHFAKGGSERQFCKLLMGIYKFLGPAVTIIDGVVAMDGRGPIKGRARHLGWLIGGVEPAACEAVCAELVSIAQDELPMLRVAKQIGFGCRELNQIRILGDDYKDFICTDFLAAEPIPIRFSLPHVCRSVCKQAILLSKSVIQGGRKPLR